MYYYFLQNTNSGEMGNQTAEGFLSSILNDDDLQLMDMAMNEGQLAFELLQCLKINFKAGCNTNRLVLLLS